MLSYIKYIYRKLFYRWRVKYLCRLGIHDPGGDRVYKKFVHKQYYSFCCMQCGRTLLTKRGKAL